jgi:MoaA/NifB/PqqE/SkfB family radical SAM enzyme
LNRSLAAKVSMALRALLTRRLTLECDRIPYHMDNLSIKKVVNWILVEASDSLRTEIPWGRPTHLQVEPTTHCNLRCALCAVTQGMKRPSGHMDFAVFKRLVDEIGDYVFIMTLWDWGEPFLNPAVFDMIGYAKQKRIKVVSSTNGHLLGRDDHAGRIIRSGLDSLIVAVDGIRQETYQHFRHGGDLQTVLDGIRTLVAKKRELRSQTPLIHLRFIVMEHNEHEIPQLKELAAALGVDALSLKTLNPSCGGADGGYLAPKDARYRRFVSGGDAQERIRRKRNPCKSLWINPAIHWNGSVCSCTFDHSESLLLGSLQDSSFEDIWFGTAYRSLRRRFRRNWESIDLCRECTHAWEGGTLNGETIAEVVFFEPHDRAAASA